MQYGNISLHQNKKVGVTKDGDCHAYSKSAKDKHCIPNNNVLVLFIQFTIMF